MDQWSIPSISSDSWEKVDSDELRLSPPTPQNHAEEGIIENASVNAHQISLLNEEESDIVNHSDDGEERVLHYGTSSTLEAFKQRCQTEGLLLEGLVTAALLYDPTLLAKVFVINSQDLLQRNDPRMKFVDSEGDLWTLIELVRQWVAVRRSQRLPRVHSNWCNKFALHLPTLKHLGEAVCREYKTFIQTSDSKPGKLTFSEDKVHVRDTLLTLLVELFPNNVLVFRGHVELGYIELNTHMNVRLHPLSALQFLGRTPDVVLSLGDTGVEVDSERSPAVFGISLDNMSLITSRPEVVDELDRRVTRFAIDNVNPQVCCVLLKKWNTDLENENGHTLKDMAQAAVDDTDVLIEKSTFKDTTLHVHALLMFHDTLRVFFKEALQDISQSLSLVKAVVNYPKRVDEFKVKLAPGCLVEDVIFPGDVNSNSVCNADKYGLDFEHRKEVRFETNACLKVALENKNGELCFIAVKAVLVGLLEHLRPDRWNFGQDEQMKSDDGQIHCKLVFNHIYSAWRGLQIIESHKKIIIQNKPDFLDKLQSFDIIIDSSIYTVLERDLRGHMQHLHRSGKYAIDWSASQNGKGYHVVHVCAQSHQTATSLLDNLKEQLAPARIPLDRVAPNWFLSNDGLFWLKYLMSSTGTMILTRPLLREVLVFGSKVGREKASGTLKSYINSIGHGGCNTRVIDCTDEAFRPDALLEYVRSFQDDTDVTIESTDLQMDFRKSSIIITSDASDEGLRQQMNVIKKKMKVSSGNLAPVSEHELQRNVSCIVCFTMITSRPISLACCGHTYCSDCMKTQLTTAIKTTSFPLCCAADNAPFSLADIYNLSGPLAQVKLHTLIKGALNKYITAHSHNYRSCPRVNCIGIMKISTELGSGHDRSLDRRVVCSHGSCRICSQCFELAHKGLSCQEYAESFRSVVGWMSENPSSRKQCPRCRVVIEKFAGCNHVQCPMCDNHVCWVCLKVFPTARHCNKHMDMVGHWGVTMPRGIYMNL